MSFKEIQINEEHKLFNTDGMFFKEFPSDLRQVRYFTLLVVQKAPPEIKELNLLEQQISELIKNAVKHGNKCDVNKKVKVWFSFSKEEARVIVEDEGKGFLKIREWNEFNRKRLECLYKEDFEELSNYVSYRTQDSDDRDGGNAMFAALEYWNSGVIYTEKANKIAVGKKFPKKQRGIEII